MRHTSDTTDTSLIQEPENLFRRFAFLELSGEKKAATAQHIINEINDIGIAYWSQMTLSVVIATFGLMIDATAVVIGAMLIAPILSPLEGIAFATTTWNKKIFLQSLWLLFLSVLLGVLIAILFTLIIPSFEFTSEILSRTQPTLIDLGIALASWVIAFLSFGYERIQSSLAWVAMAAALVPPIAVVWIWIWLLNTSVAWWSFLLFVTNLVAIILMWVIIFYMFGFYPKQKDDQQRSVRNMIGALWLLWLLCIPLRSTLHTISQWLQDRQMIDSTITQFLRTESPTTTLSEFEYESGVLDVQLLSDPENLITEPQKEELIKLIAQTLNQDIQADVSLTPVYTATAIDRLQPTLEEKTTSAISAFIREFYPSATLLTSEISENGSVVLIDMRSSWSFDTVRYRTKLTSYLENQWLLFDTLLIQWQNSPTAIQNLDQRTRTIQWVFQETFNKSLLQSLEVFENEKDTSLEITLWIHTSQNHEDTSRQLKQYQKRLEDIFETSIILLPKVQFFESMHINID